MNTAIKPKLTRRVIFRLPDDETADRFFTIADEYGLTVSDLARFALEKGLTLFETNGLTLTPTRKPRTARTSLSTTGGTAR